MPTSGAGWDAEWHGVAQGGAGWGTSQSKVLDRSGKAIRKSTLGREQLSQGKNDRSMQYSEDIEDRVERVESGAGEGRAEQGRAWHVRARHGMTRYGLA